MCAYQTIPDAYPRYLDALVSNISDDNGCQQLCSGNRAFSCRSYSFYASGSQCFLSSDDRGFINLANLHWIYVDPANIIFSFIQFLLGRQPCKVDPVQIIPREVVDPLCPEMIPHLIPAHSLVKNFFLVDSLHLLHQINRK